MEDKDDFINKAMARFKIATEAEADNHKKGLEVDRFSIELKQWPDQIQTDRNTNNQPCLVLDQTNKFLRSVTNEQRMNRPQIKISPGDDDNVDTAQQIEDKIRHIQVESQADVAYDTAVDSQTRKGWGYMRLLTVFSGENSFDQDIKIVPERNAYCIYLDPDCSDPDYPYPKWGFRVSDMQEDDYKKKYPKSELASMEIESIGNDAPEWIDLNAKKIRIAEYWVVNEEAQTIYLLPDGTVTDTVPEGIKPLKERDTVIYSVCMYKINMIEKLSTEEWAGKYIPIIPVYGDDHDVNGKRVLSGMVEPMMDEQRQFNYWSSASTEAIALAPKAPFILAEGQQSGYENMWRQANAKNYPYLIYKPVSLNGSLAPAPQRNSAEPPVQAMMTAIAQAGQNLKGTTGIYDDNLGARSNAVSGKAIMAHQKEGDVATYHYTDNFSRAQHFVGVQLLDLMPKIYDTARTTGAVSEDGKHRKIKINQPYIDKDGTPQFHDFTKGKYDVTVTTGPSFQTKRQESQDGMSQMVQSFPEIMKVAGDLVVSQFDWPGAQMLAERLEKTLPPELQDNKGQPQVPPQVQQQLAHSKQMIDALTKALNAAHDERDAKMVDNQSKERIAEQNNETKLAIAELQTTMSNNFGVFKEELAHLRGTKQMVQDHQLAMTPPPVDPNAPPPMAQQNSSQQPA